MTENRNIAGRLLPEWDDCITRAEWTDQITQLPPPIVRARVEQLVDVDDEWMTAAACIGQPPTWFFPPQTEDARGRYAVTIDTLGHEARAKEVCADCAVRADCLAFALTNNEEHGVWGGLDPRQRADLQAKAGINSRFTRAVRRRRRARNGHDSAPPPITMPTPADRMRSPA